MKVPCMACFIFHKITTHPHRVLRARRVGSSVGSSRTQPHFRNQGYNPPTPSPACARASCGIEQNAAALQKPGVSPAAALWRVLARILAPINGVSVATTVLMWKGLCRMATAPAALKRYVAAASSSSSSSRNNSGHVFTRQKGRSRGRPS